MTPDLTTVAVPEMPDGEVVLSPEFFSREDADRLFGELRAQVAWAQKPIVLYGREIMQPRLTAWYGDAEAVYSYSGVTLQPLPWIAPLHEIKLCCDAAAGVSFNSALANLYRDGQDSMGWHQDNEPELGERPVIASVSLGAVRRFQLRHKKRRDLATISLELPHGSLLLMRGTTQQWWKHHVAKTALPVGERINLTFRVIQERNGP
ncbi:MAG: alpha-ketoglutarate-dependent dioxygenase AlkB family protein [Blastocatellia bacterium]